MKLFDLFVRCRFEIPSNYIYEHYQHSESFQGNEEDLKKTLPSFLFPMNPQASMQPNCHYFVITTGDGTRHYGCSVFFKTKDQTYSIALVSTLPYFQTLKNILYVLFNSQPNDCKIANYLLTQIPMPPPGVIAVTFEIDKYQFCVSRSPPNLLPSMDLPFWLPFSLFSAKQLILIILSIVTEKQIVFTSKISGVISPFIETLITLMYPLQSYSINIPCLNDKLKDILQSPIPFLIGVNPDEISLDNLDPNVIIVNLDTSTIIYPSTNKPPPIQDRARYKLKKALNKTCKLFHNDDRKAILQSVTKVDKNFLGLPNIKNFPSKNELFRCFNKTRSGFLRFFVKVLMNDQKIADSTDTFQNEFSSFFKDFIHTQCYQSFVDKVTNFNQRGKVVHDMDDAKILFFKESIESKKNRSILKRKKVKTPFISNASWRVSRMYTCPKTNVKHPCDLIKGINDVTYSKQFTQKLNITNNTYISSPSSWNQSFYSLIPNQSHYMSKFIDKKSALIIQKSMKMFVKKSKFINMKNAAIVMNSFARMCICKMQFMEMRNSAIVIQSTFRMSVQRKHYKIMKHSAVVIQSMIRMHRVRMIFLKMKHSAVLIQSVVRMYLQKKHYSLMKHSAVLIQSTFRMHLQRKHYLLMRHSAVTIQSTFRMYLQKKHYKLMKHSAVLIQSTFRMYLQKKHYSLMKHSAVVIQSAFRMYLKKKNYILMKDSAVLIQSTFRMHLQKKHYLLMQHSAVTIQSTFRMYLQKKRYHAMQHSAVVIQSTFRKYLQQCKQLSNVSLQIFAKIFQLLYTPRTVTFTNLPNVRYYLLIMNIIHHKAQHIITSNNYKLLKQNSELIINVLNNGINSSEILNEYMNEVNEFNYNLNYSAKKMKKKVKNNQKKLYKKISKLQKKIFGRKRFDEMFRIFGINVKGKKRKAQMVEIIYNALCFTPNEFPWEITAISAKIVSVCMKKMPTESLNAYMNIRK